MRYPSSPPSPLFSNLLLLAVTLCPPVFAQTISDTTKRLNARGDNGYWQIDQPDVMILWPGDKQNIVNRFTGSAGHPHSYRLWVDPDRGSGFPVVLSNEATFNNFLEHIKLNSDKDWCQIAEVWSSWSGNTPITCGKHSYTQRRTCSIAASAEKPCPDLCSSATESRTRQVDNGPCQSEPPPPPENSCSVTDWSPARSTVCSGRSLTQRRTLADCSTDSRTVSGTRSCPQTCSTTSWSPDRNTACTGERLTQTRTMTDCSTDRRTVSGTRSCLQTCTLTGWSPSSSTVCAGESLTQTRTSANCSTERRTVNGTRSCPPTCTPTGWSPSSSTVCSGESLTQTRTLADCSTERRTVNGTRSCPPTCTPTGWSPSSSTVCSGESLTQTRTLADCSTATRTVSGARSCRPTCIPTSWSPSTGSACVGKTLTQTRTLADCSTASRTANGTRQCRTCPPPMTLLSGQCCAQWVNGNSIGCFPLN